MVLAVAEVSVTERKPTKKEKQLWHYTTRHDDVYGEEVAIEEAFDVDDYAKVQIEKTPASIPKHIEKPYTTLALLKKGSYASINKAQAEKFKKGKMTIDATLDLHGMAKDEAFSALLEFIHRAVQQNKRAVRIITGKGKNNEGIIKTALPNWVNDPLLRPFILAFDSARKDDGGEGAVYMLLKNLK